MPESKFGFPEFLYLEKYGYVKKLKFTGDNEISGVITIPTADYTDYDQAYSYLLNLNQIDNELSSFYTSELDAYYEALKYNDKQRERICKRINELTQKL